MHGYFQREVPFESVCADCRVYRDDDCSCLLRSECLQRKEPALGSGETSQFPCPNKDAGKHRLVEPAGVGVAQRWMIAAQKVETVRKLIDGSVRELEGGFALDDALVEEIGEIAIEGDLAERDHDAKARELADFSGEVPAAGANLLGGGFVAGRGAADDGGDPGVAQAKTVIAGDAFRLVG